MNDPPIIKQGMIIFPRPCRGDTCHYLLLALCDIILNPVILVGLAQDKMSAKRWQSMV